jgi:hypothetical protein
MVVAAPGWTPALPGPPGTPHWRLAAQAGLLLVSTVDIPVNERCSEPRGGGYYQAVLHGEGVGGSSRLGLVALAVAFCFAFWVGVFLLVAYLT